MSLRSKFRKGFVIRAWTRTSQSLELITQLVARGILGSDQIASLERGAEYETVCCCEWKVTRMAVLCLKAPKRRSVASGASKLKHVPIRWRFLVVRFFFLEEEAFLRRHSARQMLHPEDRRF